MSVAPSPHEVFTDLLEELNELRRAYAVVHELAYGTPGPGPGSRRGSSPADRTLQLAMSNGHAKSTMRKIARKVAKMRSLAAEADGFLGVFFEEYSKMQESRPSDPPPLDEDLADHLIDGTDRPGSELSQCLAARKKRLDGVTATLPTDRYGVV